MTRAQHLSPIHIDAHNWMYSERGKLTLVHEVRDDDAGNYIRTDTISIPWRKIEQAAAIRPKPRKRK